MTKEEAIKIFQDKIKMMEHGAICCDYGIDTDAFALAIQALEQEPCEDAISRQAVLDVLCNLGWGCEENGADTEYVSALEDCAEKVKELPYVNPQKQTGQWIEKDGYDGDTYYDCSECGESFCLIDGTPTDNLYNFCPNCGKKMESEVKNNG